MQIIRHFPVHVEPSQPSSPGRGQRSEFSASLPLRADECKEVAIVPVEEELLPDCKGRTLSGRQRQSPAAGVGLWPDARTHKIKVRAAQLTPTSTRAGLGLGSADRRPPDC